MWATALPSLRLSSRKGLPASAVAAGCFLWSSNEDKDDSSSRARSSTYVWPWVVHSNTVNNISREKPNRVLCEPFQRQGSRRFSESTDEGQQNYLRKRATLRQAAGEEHPTGAPPPRRFNTSQELNKLRSTEKDMLLRWERDEDGWRELPARAWPAYQPTPKQMKQIEKDASVKGCDKNKTTTKGGDNNNRDLCKELQFQIATTLVFYMIDAEKGLQQFESLAKSGHVDSMVACGIILLEGIGGIPIDSKKGMEWLEKAVATSSSSSPQAIYELGTVYYTGIDGIVDENPKKAYELFCEAAKLQHVAGMYMCADCLVEGEGCKMDVAKAVPLFYQAAELGHRYSRQKIRELLNKQEYKQQEQDGR